MYLLRLFYWLLLAFWFKANEELKVYDEDNDFKAHCDVRSNNAQSNRDIQGLRNGKGGRGFTYLLVSSVDVQRRYEIIILYLAKDMGV